MARAQQPVSVNGIQFDALISEIHNFEAEVPEYTTETGYVVSDNIVLKPEGLEMTVNVTNTPVTWASQGGATHISDVVAQLKELYFKRELVTVITTDETYENMAIVSMSIPKEKDKGYMRQIVFSFKKVLQTEAATTTIPDSYAKSGQTEANAGTASTSSGSTSSGSSGGSGSGSSSDSSGSSSKGSVAYNVCSMISSALS